MSDFTWLSLARRNVCFSRFAVEGQSTRGVSSPPGNQRHIETFDRGCSEKKSKVALLPARLFCDNKHEFTGWARKLAPVGPIPDQLTQVAPQREVAQQGGSKCDCMLFRSFASSGLLRRLPRVTSQGKWRWHRVLSRSPSFLVGRTVRLIRKPTGLQRMVPRAA
jgi:hypothetical protein